MYQIIHFDVFNPLCPTHWLVAAAQLLKRERYWWVVHVTTCINELELYVKLNTFSLVERRQHDRELLWYHLSENSERVLMLYVQQHYWVNCAQVVSMCTITTTTYYTPASLFEAALYYTDDVLSTNNTSSTNAITPNNPTSVASNNYKRYPS